MRDSLYLAWQYLRYHWSTTAVLVISISLIVFLPAALQVVVSNAELHLRSRAQSTPLLIGPRGSSLELTLGTVYFDKPQDDILRLEQLRRIERQQLGTVIPLHTRFVARDCLVVGTSHNYLKARKLRTARGRTWGMHGECVVGSRVAERLGIDVGDKIPVSAASAFVLDSPPLRLNVSGVLAPTETPDDEAIFVSLETTWILEGLGHGHARNAKHGTAEAKSYTDITKDNVGSFHFHGDRSEFPISAVIVYPKNSKAKTLLMGQYFSPEEVAQVVQPAEVVDALLDRIVMLRSYVLTCIALVSLVTLLLIMLVIILSVRLRRAEILTMSKMGCSRRTIASILGCQISIVLAISLGIATGLTFVTNQFGPDLVRLLVY